MKSLYLILALLVSLHTSVYSAEQNISHVVIVWLNDDVSESKVAEIIEQTEVLSTIDVVQDLKIGRAIPSDRAIVDDSFSFALTVSFKDLDDMAIYAVDKTHLNYLKTVIKPHLKKILIYDY